MKFPFRLPENKKFDAVGFGTNALDFLIVTPEYPQFNSKIELIDYVQMAGGEIASTMAGLRRLGLKTAYAGRFGKDGAGDFGLNTLIEEGVDVTRAEQIEGARTQIAFIVIDERSGERTVIWKRDAKLSYAPEEAPIEIVRDTKVFHATPHDALACARMARAARDAGAIVSIDIDNLFAGIEELLPLIDVFIASEEFPARLVGIKDKRRALREIKSRYGYQIAGVTLGEKGSLLLCEDRFVETAGFAVPNGCKDTTGAGDAFRVGLLYGLLQNESVETAARMANAVAALKCRELGARTALPNVAELNSLLLKSS
ncbi:MAG TPA: carbohydrate kinase family protein [Pyrinomonadaceae bacterium]|nr:carbohydrate kinase family protein [Pyrinomonadaceae bacterium]